MRIERHQLCDLACSDHLLCVQLCPPPPVEHQCPLPPPARCYPHRLQILPDQPTIWIRLPSHIRVLPNPLFFRPQKIYYSITRVLDPLGPRRSSRVTQTHASKQQTHYDSHLVSVRWGKNVTNQRADKGILGVGYEYPTKRIYLVAGNYHKTSSQINDTFLFHRVIKILTASNLDSLVPN